MTIEAQQRAAVVAQARSFLGTRYHHQGRQKIARDAAGKTISPGGVDCATLLAEVYTRAGIVPPIVMPHYPPDWHMHQTSEQYLSFVQARAHPIEQAQALPGDIVLYRYGHAYCHGAIIVDPGWPAIVQSYYRARAVVAGAGDGGEWGDKPRRFFSFW